jgi:hypothetical protein
MSRSASEPTQQRFFLRANHAAERLRIACSPVSGKMREDSGKGRICLREDAGLSAFILVKWRFFGLFYQRMVGLPVFMVSFWLACWGRESKKIRLKTMI